MGECDPFACQQRTINFLHHLLEKKLILQHVSAHASVNVQDARGPCWARYLAQLLGPSVLLRLVGGMLLNTA